MEENGAIVISNYHHGEVYEARNEFKHSMFHRVYRRAYDVVQDSVCRQLSDSKNGFFQENIDNIVTFVGRRGTGKSSAMISFMQGLLDNNKGEEAPNYTIYKNQEKTGEKGSKDCKKAGEEDPKGCPETGEEGKKGSKGRPETGKAGKKKDRPKDEMRKDTRWKQIRNI